MASVFPLLLFVIFIACVAILYTDGMWSNAVRLINVISAALLATTFWEPLANWLDAWDLSYTFAWDFLALWALFVVFMVVFRMLTDALSKVNVRFLKIVDRIGSAVFAAWIGWVMVCFTTFTMHTAPLARNFLGGGFDPEQRMFGGTAPDRQWLGFVQKMSLGAFCRSATAEEREKETYVFDPKGEFLPKYATRRARLEAQVKKADSIRVRPEEVDAVLTGGVKPDIRMDSFMTAIGDTLPPAWERSFPGQQVTSVKMKVDTSSGKYAATVSVDTIKGRSRMPVTVPFKYEFKNNAWRLAPDQKGQEDLAKEAKNEDYLKILRSSTEF